MYIEFYIHDTKIMKNYGKRQGTTPLSSPVEISFIFVLRDLHNASFYLKVDDGDRALAVVLTTLHQEHSC